MLPLVMYQITYMPPACSVFYLPTGGRVSSSALPLFRSGTDVVYG
jgi:hypothetical protein